MENKNGIREIAGIKYQIIRTPCKCRCHNSGYVVLHVMACCNNGVVERLERIK